MATYGPGIDLSQHAKSVSHIIKLIIHLSIGEKPNISTLSAFAARSISWSIHLHFGE